MADTLIGSRTGTVFELKAPTQMLFECVNRCNGLKKGNQEIILENLTTNEHISIASSTIGLNKPEMMTNSSCLMLQAGVYRWSQIISYEDGSPPITIVPDTNMPRTFANFGIGGPVTLEFINEGITTITTLTSADQGRMVFVKGKIFYDLLDGERLEALIDVVNMTNGQVLSTGQCLVDGADADMIAIEVDPFIISAGHYYKISLKIVTMGIKPAKCILIQKGEIIN
jgi:hypothetical protein